MKRQTFNIISKKSLSEPSKSTKMISGGFIVDREPIISNGYISTYIDQSATVQLSWHFYSS